MIKSVTAWLIKSIAIILLTALAFPLSPIIALFITHEEESEATGFPSMFPGKPREFLIPFLRIWQSPDAPVDEWWFGDYVVDGYLKTHYTQADYDTKAWLRYVCRVIWLCRNAAYGFGAKFGYEASGMIPLMTHDNESLWKSGLNCFSFWSVKNSAGQIGWCIRAQLYYCKPHCLEMYLGYKIMGDTIQGKKLVAIQFTPFRKYSRQS